MKFVYAFPGLGVPPISALFSASVLCDQAVAAERAGFSAVSLDEHPAPAEVWRQDPSGHDTVDPFVALAGVAAATSQLRLFTGLCVVPYRNPFLIAKAAATLDVLCEGRLSLGVGTGYLEGEFEALGVDFSRRNELFDEAITVMKLAWTGEPVVYEGIGFNARGNTCQPMPVQRPHPPLWIGGNSKLSLRRAAAYAAGWMAVSAVASPVISRHSPRMESLDDLRERIGMLRAYEKDVDRTEPVEIMCYGLGRSRTPDEFVALVRELEDMGMATVVISGTGSTRAEALDNIQRYGDIIARCA